MTQREVNINQTTNEVDNSKTKIGNIKSIKHENNRDKVFTNKGTIKEWQYVSFRRK